MKLGTVVYDSKIYNLDYMTAEEMMQLLKRIENDKKNNLSDAKNAIDENINIPHNDLIMNITKFYINILIYMS